MESISEFSISSSILYEQLGYLYKVINSRPLVAILEDFLFEIKDNKLTITASDLQTTMTSNIRLDQYNSDIQIAIPAKILLETIKNLPDQSILFQIHEGNNIILKANNGEYSLVGENAKHYPKDRLENEQNSYVINGPILKEILQCTLPFASHDSIKPVINSVLFDFIENHPTFVATDVMRLVKFEHNEIQISQSSRFIVPKKSLQLLSPILNNDIYIQVFDNKVAFSNDNMTLISNLINEKYPNYENAIPNNNNNKVCVSTNDLISTLKRLCIYTNDITHQVNFNISSNIITITAEDPRYEKSAVERLSCICECDINEIMVSFNAKLLLELLQNCNYDEITIYISNPDMNGKVNKAVIIKPSEPKDNQDILFLIMPIFSN